APRVGLPDPEVLLADGDPVRHALGVGADELGEGVESGVEIHHERSLAVTRVPGRARCGPGRSPRAGCGARARWAAPGSRLAPPPAGPARGRPAPRPPSARPAPPAASASGSRRRSRTAPWR